MDWIMIHWGGWREWLVPLAEFGLIPATYFAGRLFRGIE